MAAIELKYPLSSYLIIFECDYGHGIDIELVLERTMMPSASLQECHRGSKLLCYDCFRKIRKYKHIRQVINNKRYVNQSIKIVPKYRVSNKTGFRTTSLQQLWHKRQQREGEMPKTNEKYIANEKTGRLHRSEIDNSGCFNTVILERTGNVPFFKAFQTRE